MNDVEEENGDPHRCRVEDVHENFMIRDAAVDAGGVFDQAENDADRDQGQNCVQCVQQLQSTTSMVRGRLVVYPALESDGDVDEDQDEELLESYASHVDVQSGLCTADQQLIGRPFVGFRPQSGFA